MKRLMWDTRVIGDYPDDWEPPKGSDLSVGLADGSMLYVTIPQAVPPTTAELANIEEANCLSALNGGNAGINTRKLIKAMFVSNLAWRLGKAPGALTLAELTAERNRIAAIYKAI